ncbi:hypothetical protein IKA15_02270 [bacterium]|nr:hypothetical protein [bacterium]
MLKQETVKAYDVIFVAMDPNGMIEPYQRTISGGYSIGLRSQRAKKYLNM